MINYVKSPIANRQSPIANRQSAGISIAKIFAGVVHCKILNIIASGCLEKYN